MKKRIFTIIGIAKTGKTETIRRVYGMIKKCHRIDKKEHVIGSSCINDRGDFRRVITIDGVKIGIESQGDPGNRSRIFESLKLFSRIKCDIIVCATRTRGKTLDAVRSYQATYDIKTRTSERIDGNDKRNMASVKMAKAIYVEIKNLITSYKSFNHSS
ncbi:MAG: hypothetical protein WC708_03630 [Lentisphaeria bacterium]